MLNKNELPDNPDQLKDIIAQLRDDYANLASYTQDLEEMVILLRRWRYAASSEKQAHKQSRQPNLFDEVHPEAGSSEEPVCDHEAEPASEPASTSCAGHASGDKRGGKQPLPKALPREDIYTDIPEADKLCPCGQQRQRMGESCCEKLAFLPARIWVRRYHRPKYACRSCEGTADETASAAVQAPLPPQVIPQGIATPELVACVLTHKFVDSLPLYRQERMFARMGITLSRQTLSRWVIQAAEPAAPLLWALDQDITAGDYIQMDETRVQVLGETDRSPQSPSYMWVLRGGRDPTRPLVRYHYDPSRSSEVASRLLAGFEGYVQTDGYAGYNAVCQQSTITRLGCWAHVRRKFMEVQKTRGKKHKSGMSDAVLKQISRLYHIEKQIRRQQLSAEQACAYRQEQAQPVIDQIGQYLKDYADKVPPSSLLGKAVTYARHQWPQLTVYLEDGRLHIDNNLVENAIRPFALGRKNWLFAGAVSGAHASAAWYSLTESARANGLEPHSYLAFVLSQVPCLNAQDADITAYQDLLPNRIDPATLQAYLAHKEASQAS